MSVQLPMYLRIILTFCFAMTHSNLFSLQIFSLDETKFQLMWPMRLVNRVEDNVETHLELERLVWSIEVSGIWYPRMWQRWRAKYKFNSISCKIVKQVVAGQGGENRLKYWTKSRNLERPFCKLVLSQVIPIMALMLLIVVSSLPTGSQLPNLRIFFKQPDYCCNINTLSTISTYCQLCQQLQSASK